MSYLLCTYIHENLKLKWFFGARRQANTNKLKTVSYSKSPANVHSAKMVAPERVMPPSRTSWVRFRRPRRQEQPRAQTKNRRNQRPSGVMRARQPAAAMIWLPLLAGSGLCAPPAALAQGCRQCSDVPSVNLRKRGLSCESATNALAQRCNRNSAWIAGRFCEYSCYVAGRAYGGTACCEGGATTGTDVWAARPNKPPLNQEQLNGSAPMDPGFQADPEYIFSIISATAEKIAAETGVQQTSAGVCSETCSADFVSGCMPYQCSQSMTSIAAWSTCRLEIDTGVGPLATKAGCALRCADSRAMALARISGCDGANQRPGQKGPPDAAPLPPGTAAQVGGGNGKNNAKGEKSSTQAGPSAAAQDESAQWALAQWAAAQEAAGQKAAAQLAKENKDKGEKDKGEKGAAPVAPTFPQAGSSPAATANACSETCSADFVSGCMPYQCGQGMTSVAAWTTCRLEIDTGVGPLVTKAGCALRCADSTAMARARNCGCDAGCQQPGQQGSFAAPKPSGTAAQVGGGNDKNNAKGEKSATQAGGAGQVGGGNDKNNAKGDNNSFVNGDAAVAQQSTVAAGAQPVGTLGRAEIIMDWNFPFGQSELEPISARVGDTIVFEWSGPISHSVAIINPNRSCDFENSAELGVESPVRYTIQAEDVGVLRFACSVPGHCRAGMVLSVSVVAQAPYESLQFLELDSTEFVTVDTSTSSSSLRSSRLDGNIFASATQAAESSGRRIAAPGAGTGAALAVALIYATWLCS